MCCHMNMVSEKPNTGMVTFFLPFRNPNLPLLICRFLPHLLLIGDDGNNNASEQYMVKTDYFNPPLVLVSFFQEQESPHYK